MTKVKHDEAIRVLKMCSDPLSFLVRHEPAPVGLKEITLVTKQGEGFGLVITGGVSSYSGNPMDDTDEGIFISQVCRTLHYLCPETPTTWIVLIVYNDRTCFFFTECVLLSLS